MALCTICGGADYLRCGCNIEPYCDQCNENDQCNSEMDSLCVIYHPTYPGQTPLPSKLTNLGMPNGSSAEAIFEAIDTFLANSANTPIVPVDSNSVDLTVSGFANHTLRADLKISPDTNNQLEIRTNGVYAKPYDDLFKVKVNAADTPDYLENQLVGASDGCVSITTLTVAEQVQITPSLDLQCLANAYCDIDNAIARGTLAACLFATAFDIADTNSINLSFIGGLPKVLSADAKISADVGNTISIHADGLFAAGSAITADNGLNVTSGPVELGGLLIKHTSIDFANAYQLNLFNTPKLNIGSLGPASSYLTVTNIDPTIPFTSQVSTTFNLENSSHSSSFSILALTGGAFVHNNNLFDFANGGQLNFLNTGNITLGSSISCIYSGIYGAVGIAGSGSITGHTIAGGYFQAAASGSSNVTNVAGIEVNGVNSITDLVSYTGTITNYYGILIDDIAASNFGGSVTNRFAIYQSGTTDVSRFFGPVQNASSTVQFTSDARVKENIAPFTRGLSEIDSINTKTFNYTYNKSRSVTGIIAQELELVIPEAVQQGNFNTPDGEEFTDFRMVDQTVLFYTMFNAIKDLSSQNKVLNNRLLALEGKS